MARRIGRDTSFIPLMLGPVGIGIPRWMPLVLLYFTAVFGLASLDGPLGPQASTLAAALGPGIIGLLDLTLRLRVSHYEWVNPAGVTVVTEASILDRLTFRECGWYLPVIVLPLPWWLLGTGLSVAFTRSWGLI